MLKMAVFSTIGKIRELEALSNMMFSFNFMGTKCKMLYHVFQCNQHLQLQLHVQFLLPQKSPQHYTVINYQLQPIERHEDTLLYVTFRYTPRHSQHYTTPPSCTLNYISLQFCHSTPHNTTSTRPTTKKRPTSVNPPTRL